MFLGRRRGHLPATLIHDRRPLHWKLSSTTAELTLTRAGTRLPLLQLQHAARMRSDAGRPPLALLMPGFSRVARSASLG
eukprot:14404070-Alexandrium_andersonii.AAC.1